MKKEYDPIEDYRKELEYLILRFFIKQKIKNYRDDITYVIYDGTKIEEYSQELHQLKRELKGFKSYLVVRTLKLR